MCGIVGYVGERPAIPVLLGALEKLEYRGYDSAGIGIVRESDALVIKNKGKVSLLEEKLSEQALSSNLGIGHTRWATHGIPNELNAHPHTNAKNNLFIIHN